MDKSRWIYISPHLDDAVLSCGGIIREQTRQGIPVEIWTLISGFPATSELTSFAQLMHFQWGTGSAEETVALRRSEDAQAAAAIGATTRHFDTPDCIYRRSPEGEPLYPLDIFVPPHPLEADLDRAIAAELQTLLLPEDTFVCPLTIGGHVDHTLARKAVEHLANPIRYYADIPYLLTHREELAPATRGMRRELFPVSEAGLYDWQDAIASYKSQITVLFETEERMRSLIRTYWETEWGIHLWQAEAPGTA